MLAKRIVPCLDIKNGQTDKGTNIVNVIDMGEGEKITSIISVAGFEDN